MKRALNKVDLSRFILCSVTLACTVLLSNPVFSQSITTDGNTATNLSTNGNITNITTGTIRNSNAFNSFSRFNVDSGKTVNLVIPNSANNLINTVSGAPSQINGVLNSVKKGQIGGNVYLLNPYGIVVGSSGRINTGSLTAITPTRDFINNFYTSPGNPNPDSVSQVLNGSTTVNSNACIENRGIINSINGISINSGYIVNKGDINAGVNSNNNHLAQIVNLDSVKQSVTTGKNIILNADKKITIASGCVNTPTDLTLNSEVVNVAGDLKVSRDLSLTAALANVNGDIKAGRDFLLVGKMQTLRESLNVNGDIKVGRDFNIRDYGFYTINAAGDIKVGRDLTAFGYLENSNITTNADIFTARNISITGPVNLRNLNAGGYVDIIGEGGIGTGNIVAGDFVSLNSVIGGGVSTGDVTARNDITMSSPEFAGGAITTGNLNGRNISLTSVGDREGSITTKNICARVNVDLTAGIIASDSNLPEGTYINGTITTGNIKAGGKLIASTFTNIGVDDPVLLGSGSITMKDLYVNSDINLTTETLKAGYINSGRNINILTANGGTLTKDICTKNDLIMSFITSQSENRLGNLKAGRNIIVNTDNADFYAGYITAGNDIDILTFGGGVKAKDLAAGGKAEISTGLGVSEVGVIKANKNVNLGASEGFIDTKDITAGIDVNIGDSYSAGITTGNICARNSVNMGNSVEANIDTKKIVAGNDVTFNLDSGSRISTGNISAKDDVTASVLDNSLLTTGNICAGGNVNSIMEFSSFETQNITAGNTVQVLGFGSGFNAGNITAGRDTIIGLSQSDGTIGNIKAGRNARANIGEGLLRIGDISAGLDIDLGAGNFGELRTANLKAGRDVDLGVDIGGSIITEDICAGNNITLDADASGNFIQAQNIKAGGNLLAASIDFEGNLSKATRFTLGDINVGRNVTIVAETIETGNINAGGTVTLDDDFAITTKNINAGKSVSLNAPKGSIKSGHITSGDNIAVSAKKSGSGRINTDIP